MGMRLFLAVHLTDEIRANLAVAQARLKATGADVRWVEPENFHLTVKFLGDIEDDLLPDVEYNSEWTAGESTAFRFRVRGVSVFPRNGPEIKTLWAAVVEGGDSWRAVAEKAQEAFAPFGVPREGGLVPHITLGRVKSDRSRDALRTAIEAEAETEFGTQDAHRLTLIQSTLTPHGAIYKDIQSWDLNTSPFPNPLL
ncbi:MAG: RNA 2',3'-cyclic phosphodiesterase [Armatimonadaceae bacterium]